MCLTPRQTVELAAPAYTAAIMLSQRSPVSCCLFGELSWQIQAAALGKLAEGFRPLSRLRVGVGPSGAAVWGSSLAPRTVCAFPGLTRATNMTFFLLLQTGASS